MTSRLLEKILWGLGGTALMCSLPFYGLGVWKQWAGAREFDALRISTPTVTSAAAPADGAVIGRLELPRLGTRAVVFEGTSDSELAAGIGHVRSTSLDPASGNIALAAHRDTFFAGLQQIRAGDEIRFASVQGVAVYKVATTRIINPEDTEVLRPTLEPTLTLITCYPFEFFGPAPQRFIVQATRADRQQAANLSSP